MVKYLRQIEEKRKQNKIRGKEGETKVRGHTEEKRN